MSEEQSKPQPSSQDGGAAPETNQQSREPDSINLSEGRKGMIALPVSEVPDTTMQDMQALPDAPALAPAEAPPADSAPPADPAPPPPPSNAGESSPSE